MGKKNVILCSSQKKIERKWTTFVQDICSINQAPGQMPRLKVGRGGKNDFFLQQSLGAVRNEY